MNQRNIDLISRSSRRNDGGIDEAKRRWKVTADWRRSNLIDTILFKPIPEFFEIKKAYPQSHFRKTKPVFEDVHTGEKFSHLVYYEKPGKVDVDKLIKIGMKVSEG